MIDLHSLFPGADIEALKHQFPLRTDDISERHRQRGHSTMEVIHLFTWLLVCSPQNQCVNG